QIRAESYAVIEIGIDEPGWMDQHLEVVQPNFGIITTIAEEHLENLKNLETVAEEELKLLRYLRDSSGGFAANVDSSWIANESLPNNSVPYGLQQPAESEGVFHAPQELHAFRLMSWTPLPRKHNAQNR